jgi:hypothetical protein
VSADLTQLTTAFSGVQLVVVVYLMMELRHMAKEQAKAAIVLASQAVEIGKLNRTLSNVMGRLQIPTEDD